VAELVTWCRIFNTGPVCPTPCDDCRRTSRINALVAQAGGPAVTLAAAHAELGMTGATTEARQADTAGEQRAT
jgi:hypothetical protein